jgi:hypothetical protein
MAVNFLRKAGKMDTQKSFLDGYFFIIVKYFFRRWKICDFSCEMAVNFLRKIGKIDT